MPEWISQLAELDRELFTFLNGIRAQWLDMPMYLVSQGWAWFWVYAIAIWALLKNYNWRYMVAVMVGIGLVVLFADRGSVELFKNVFQRPRPSHNPLLEEGIFLVKGFSGEVYRGGKYGFISSHASNYFGIATYLALFLSRITNKWWFWLMLWAALISYSRIYLGVHYPSDVAVGALFGMLCGFVAYIIVDLIIKKHIQPDPTP